MKLSMMVLMTSCAPKRALSAPGIAPQRAARERGRQHRGGNREHARQRHVRAHERRGEAAQVHLALDADVEEPRAKRQRDREPA